MVNDCLWVSFKQLSVCVSALPSDVRKGIVVKKEDKEDPEPPHIKEEQEDPEHPHIKEEQEDPEPPHIKEDQEDPEPSYIKEEQEDPEPPHIKEEQEELWSSQEGEQLQGLEEADITKFPFTPVPVKSEDDEEKPQSSQLHQRLTEQMETEADGEDCGGPEPDRNSHPDTHLQPVSKDGTGEFSVAEIEVSIDDWKETREPRSGLNSLKNNGVPVREKLFSCSVCDRRFLFRSDLKRHMKIHTGEKPYSCSVCGKAFRESGTLKQHMKTHTRENHFNCSVCDKKFSCKANMSRHMTTHTGEKPFSCSVCNKRFTWRLQLKKHKCVGHQTSQLHQRQMEQMEADGEDCGGPEPDRNSHPDTHLQPEAEDKTGDSSEPEIDDSDDCKETREPQSGLNFLKNDHVSEKPFSCSECTKGFSSKGNLKEHMRIHTGEKPFSCSVCDKRFLCKAYLIRHLRSHAGEKPFSCSVCKKSFTHRGNLEIHMAVHTGEKLFSCSVCNKKFAWRCQIKRHKCVHSQSS
ncbi:gastrula zinc finger protein XlCGF57.1-like, partial [Plectropomus leopardus]|uniref:gastrula zinc finger protein XlCGF57.1-like n=1 Tax=Plectropomus leopardus TaxID=160734 RepID=UPI001C4C332E